MFGSKLRSWMEAVRPRKNKQHRNKDKNKNNAGGGNNVTGINNTSSSTAIISGSTPSTSSSSNNWHDVVQKTGATPSSSSSSVVPQPSSNSSRYSTNNLSSPESAYSTGYSTDGTSPGAPPDYYVNIRSANTPYNNGKGTPSQIHQANRIISNTRENDAPARFKHHPIVPIVSVHQPCQDIVTLNPPEITTATNESIRDDDGVGVESKGGNYSSSSTHHKIPTPTFTIQSSSSTGGGGGVVVVPSPSPGSRLGGEISSPILTSPRQRNRIRTNPWVPGSSLSPGPIRQEFSCTIGGPTEELQQPAQQRHQRTPSGTIRPVQSPSSSSSSLSVHHHWNGDGRTRRTSHGNNCSGGSEDDCTLNEMMGKYDESYVYEKETDILSDSDPTDCDTDIDTGQDGGDEDDPLESGEFDFIDNGSYLELEHVKGDDNRNTGHCVYYNFEAQRSSRRRINGSGNRRNYNNKSEKRRRSSSNKKRHKYNGNNNDNINNNVNGSKSAGATPISVRRSHPSNNNYNNSNKVVPTMENNDMFERRRSNSVNFIHPSSYYAGDHLSAIDRSDKEAEKKYKQLIVEAEQILRHMKVVNSGLSPRRVPGPANKRVEILKNQYATSTVNKMPSNNFNATATGTAANSSCTSAAKLLSPKKNHITNFKMMINNNNSPIATRREVMLTRGESPLLRARKNSPKYRRKNKGNNRLRGSSSSSDTDEGNKAMKFPHYYNHQSAPSTVNNFNCPQSEPVRRKVYGCGKTVAFNLATNYDKNLAYDPNYKSSAENMRQQALLNTITNLKRSLEDQSASLKQVYKSSQNIYL